MSFQKVIKSLFKLSGQIEKQTEKPQRKTPTPTPQKPQVNAPPSYLQDFQITGTPFFVDLMTRFYQSNKHLIPPEAWKFPKGVKTSWDLMDYQGDFDGFEVMEIFKEASGKISSMYFNFLDKIQKAQKEGDDSMTLNYCGLSLSLIQPFVKYEILQYGSFDITTIPAIEIGTRLYLEKNLMGQLKNLEEVVDNIPELSEWKKYIEEEKKEFEFMVQLEKGVLEKITSEPGILQKDIKKAFGENNGKFVQRALNDLEEKGKITRQKKGSSYELFSAMRS